MNWGVPILTLQALCVDTLSFVSQPLQNRKFVAHYVIVRCYRSIRSNDIEVRKIIKKLNKAISIHSNRSVVHFKFMRSLQVHNCVSHGLDPKARRNEKALFLFSSLLSWSINCVLTNSTMKVHGEVVWTDSRTGQQYLLTYSSLMVAPTAHSWRLRSSECKICAILPIEISTLAHGLCDRCVLTNSNQMWIVCACAFVD